MSTLIREHKLLTEMFEKRKSLSYSYDYALELVDYKEERIDYLLTHSVITRNGNFLEIDDQFLQFFEQVLGVNEEINVSTINENIRNVKENMLYYLKEDNQSRKYNYLRNVKNALRKIGNVTVRNVIDLKRNIENTFKNEPNYTVKKAKLENLDIRRMDIDSFIDQTDKLISGDEEQTFFRTAPDDELNNIIIQLKLQINECRHNLVHIQKQIIEFLNQINYQSKVIEKLRQVKHLKDQFVIRAATNIIEVLTIDTAVVFESNPSYPLKLSYTNLQSDPDARTSILKVSKKWTTSVKVRMLIAGSISEEYLQANNEEEIQVNMEEVRNNFLASGNNLFDFVLGYNFEKELSFDEKVTVYCQLISLYEESFVIEENFDMQNEVEYAIVYPK